MAPEKTSALAGPGAAGMNPEKSSAPAGQKGEELVKKIGKKKGLKR
jgi:hypothetical protein